jgi:hypothetical protein
MSAAFRRTAGRTNFRWIGSRIAIVLIAGCAAVYGAASASAQGPQPPGGPGFGAPPFGPPSPFAPPNVAPNRNAPALQPAAAPQPDAKPNGLGAIGGAIAGGVAGVLIALVFWAMRRAAVSPVRTDPKTGGILVAFTPGLRWLMVGFSAFTPTVILIVGIVLPPQNSGAYVVVAVVILLFAALGGSLCWGLFKARLVATNEKLIAESGWRKRRTLAWSEVVEVKRDSSGGLMFRAANAKQNIVVSPMMGGLKQLVDLMRQKLPAPKYEAAEPLLKMIDQLQEGDALVFMTGAPRKGAGASAAATKS